MFPPEITENEWTHDIEEYRKELCAAMLANDEYGQESLYSADEVYEMVYGMTDDEISDKMERFSPRYYAELRLV